MPGTRPGIWWQLVGPNGPAPQLSAEAALTWATSRDLRRAAWFLWITPFAAALSMPLDGEAQALVGVVGAGLGGGHRRLGTRLELGAHGLVALAAHEVLLVALDLALDVRHGGFSRFTRLRTGNEMAGTGYRGRGRDVTSGGESTRRYARATPPMDLDRIRNVSIIAHIDHGKSTLADRLLELTGAVDPREMRDQYLDSMDLERERGITIKLQSVRLDYRDHVIDLIDTPGHVDFGYEVSRSLAACEGVILLVDAAQGIEAQTLANCYLALEHDLEIVAALNKIDLPAADPDRYAAEIEKVLGIPADQILRISAKTGAGVGDLLDAVIERVPPPTGDASAPLQALIFDSHYDAYRGVVSSVRVVNGSLTTGTRLRFMQAGATHDADEVGIRTPGERAGAGRWARARRATSSPASRTWARPGRARR